MSTLVARFVCVGTLHRSSDPSRPSVVELSGGPAGGALTVGRSRDKVDVHCDDPMVSALHCRLTVKQRSESSTAQVWVEDLSSNGTFVNAQRVGKGRSVPLSHMDEVGLLVPCSGPDAAQRPPFAFICMVASVGDPVSGVDLKLAQHNAHALTLAQGPHALTLASNDVSSTEPTSAMVPASTWASSDAIREATDRAVRETEAAAARSLERAVEDAVSDANRASDELRKKAVESAASAVAEHWSVVHQKGLAEEKEAAAARQQSAVATALEEATERARVALQQKMDELEIT